MYEQVDVSKYCWMCGKQCRSEDVLVPLKVFAFILEGVSHFMDGGWNYSECIYLHRNWSYETFVNYKKKVSQSDSLVPRRFPCSKAIPLFQGGSLVPRRFLSCGSYLCVCFILICSLSLLLYLRDDLLRDCGTS